MDFFQNRGGGGKKKQISLKFKLSDPILKKKKENTEFAPFQCKYAKIILLSSILSNHNNIGDGQVYQEVQQRVGTVCWGN